MKTGVAKGPNRCLVKFINKNLGLETPARTSTEDRQGSVAPGSSELSAKRWRLDRSQHPEPVKEPAAGHIESSWCGVVPK